MKLRLAELTAAEARAALAGRPVILLPLGSHEDQGPVAPMGDYLSAERIGELIAARACAEGVPALLAPALAFGAADYFGSVPGGLALSPATFRAVLADLFACLLRHGLDRLILLNGHGGNAAPIHEATLALRRQHGVVAPSLQLWRIAALLQAERDGEAASRSSGHGADPLGSIARHLFPDWVRPDLAAAPAPPGRMLGLPVCGFGTIRFETIEIGVPVELDLIAPSGATADPALCSAATGAALVERLVGLGARFVRHFAEQTS